MDCGLCCISQRYDSSVCVREELPGVGKAFCANCWNDLSRPIEDYAVIMVPDRSKNVEGFFQWKVVQCE